MANMKYFSDFNGETTELVTLRGMDNKEFAAKYPGIKGIRYDGFQMRVGQSAIGTNFMPMTRAIEYKSFPSKHECNAKCLNGKCNGKCECRCGGKNHGRGSIAA